MRVQRLMVSNFRAITELDLDRLEDVVVIAGPNGCGKSCVFDAIRLLKSVYGGYQPNEWQSWFGEFQINVQNVPGAWLSLFQDKNKSMRVMADFILSAAEVAYLKTEARTLLSDRFWREEVPELGIRRASQFALATSHRIHKPKIDKRVEVELPRLLEEIARTTLHAEVNVSPSGAAQTAPSPLLEMIFGLYEPQHLGIIDYHGANRNYAREQVGQVNLNIEGTENKLRQHALYNVSNKYQNLKTEMAGSYVRHLLAVQADAKSSPDASLSETLQELFATFFPGKTFLGPRPTADGRLAFPVRTPSGAEHDIDDLSSGEKEVLYGYLRLRNAAPMRSVLLIDEPELHLNPRLVSGLASFYHRHLGRVLENQLWLVTHSDTLIREAVGQTGFSVFHLQPAGQYEGSNQASRVRVGQDVERLIVGLVGDLASYRPGAKIVIFEGGGSTDFDVRMVCTLFPRFQAMVNPIAGGSKRQVAQLYEVLESARIAGHLPARFYSITDWDGEPLTRPAVPTRLQWDVYHIENYLLEPRFILKVLGDLNLARTPVASEDAILDELRHCAAETVPELVGHKLRVKCNAAVMASLDIGFNPKRGDIGVALAESIERSFDRLGTVVANDLTRDKLGKEERTLTVTVRADLSTDRWRSTFRGRDILRRFANRHLNGMAYEQFRDLIIARMRDAEFQPNGMSRIIEQVLNDADPSIAAPAVAR